MCFLWLFLHVQENINLFIRHDAKVLLLGPNARKSVIVESSEVIAVGGVCNVVSLGGQVTDVCDDRLQLVDILASEQHFVAEDGLTEESVDRDRSKVSGQTSIIMPSRGGSSARPASRQGPFKQHQSWMSS